MKRHKRSIMYSITRYLTKRTVTKFHNGNNSNRTCIDSCAISHVEGTSVSNITDSPDGVFVKKIVQEVEFSIL